MTPPAPLSDADCPLLLAHGGPAARTLLDRYAAGAAALAAAPADPVLSGAGADKLDHAAAPLRKARDKLARKKYVVGFIGLTQAGKSTTVNRVVGEEVCKMGAGDATSSQPARLIRADRRSVDVEYLTPARFADRRRAAAEAVGLSDPADDDAALLGTLSDPNKFATAGDRPRLKDDLAYLKEFLTAKRRHGSDVLREPARSDDGLDFARRNEFVTHRSGESGAKELLIREARFHLDNPNLPVELQLCDLPGLDSKRSIDDIVTKEYLPELDGTFLFVNVAMNLKSAGTRGTLAMIGREFGSRAGARAWLIFTKMDTLTREHFRLPPAESIFDVISSLLVDTGIPASQVCFCSNKLADTLRELQAAPVPAPPEPPPLAAWPAMAAQTLSQSVTQPVPATCPPELRPAWDALLADGGVGRIRQLMTAEVGRSLAGQIRQDADAFLTEAADRLERLKEAEAAKLAGGHDLLERVTTCRDVVMDLNKRLARRPDQFPSIAAEGDALRAELGKLFENEATVRVVSDLSGEPLADEFKLHARRLENMVKDRLKAGGGLDAVYQAVGDELNGLPEVPLKGGKSCAEAWHGFRRADRDAGWLGGAGFVSADVDDLLRAGGDELNGPAYLDLMRDKVGAAVRQTLHHVRGQLRTRLTELQADLTLLTNEPTLGG